MNVDFLLKNGLQINDLGINPVISLDYFETLVKDYFVNSETENTKIITYQGVEFCFKDEEISYWQIDSNDDLDKELLSLFEMNFQEFLQFLKDKEVEWEFNTRLCFSNQLSVLIKDTRIEFLFGFEDQVEGELEAIGQSFS